jgi:hypothetical protein
MPLGQRDLRIDFFRGVALFSIAVDHTAGNAFGQLTLRCFGVSDAAEVFVFLSGLVCARAYGRVLDRQGLLIAEGKALRRAGVLYAAHIAALLGALALATVGRWRGLEVAMLRAGPFFDAPSAALPAALVLREMPYALDILPLYMVFLVALPPMLLLARHSIVAMLAVSAAVYATAVCLPGLEPMGRSGAPGWFVNPLAWQLLFFLGVAVGADTRREAAAWRPGLGPTLVAAVLVVAGVAARVAETLAARGILDGAFDLDVLPFTEKRLLGVLRLAWFLAAAHLVATLLPAGLAAWRSPWLRPLVRCGQQALPVYATGVCISWAGSLVLAAWPGRLVVDLAVTGAALGLQMGVARASEAFKARRARRSGAREPLAPARDDRSRSTGRRERRTSWESRSRPVR